jgi:hypothetical protein
MYFSQFPKKLYSFDFSEKNPTLVTDIFSRFQFKSAVLNNAVAYDRYQLRDGDTPEIVAYQKYGDPKLHWVICMVNNLIDPQFSMPLPRDALERYIIKKYGYTVIENAYSNVYHYVLEVKDTLTEVNGPTTTTTSNSVISLQQFSYSANTLETKIINVPETSTTTFYANNSDNTSAVIATLTKTSTYKAVYVYEYEDELNEAKREIKLLKPQYISGLVLELETVLNG